VQFLRQTPASAVLSGPSSPSAKLSTVTTTQTSQRENNDRIPFTLTFHPDNHAVKSITLKKFKLFQNDPDTGRIFSQPLHKQSTESRKSLEEKNYFSN